MLDASEIDSETRHDLVAALRRMRLIGASEEPDMRALTGGVSSLVVRVDAARGVLCLKRALPKLKVSADWFAPVERNQAEAAWLREASVICPDAVPAILAEDTASSTFAMEFFEPSAYRVWKEQLLAGDVVVDTAVVVGRVMATIHRATAGHEDIRRRFATDANFWALRLEPYLIATAGVHPDIASRLRQIAEITASTQRVLVHGDVSPKNVLVGGRRIVLLDAECAWYGDPAFDLAFCLNHLILKSALPGANVAMLAASFRGLTETYRQGVTWERISDLDARTASLLPALLLARIDGKSPVEYMTDELRRNRTRRFARRMLNEPSADVVAVWSQWEKEQAG
jgi:aminoglycoside phosphotransferase (APT) family kinase protein